MVKTLVIGFVFCWILVGSMIGFGLMVRLTLALLALAILLGALALVIGLLRERYSKSYDYLD